ncbi:MAG TPA: 16S rRNA (guanine(527)-N(7))-methyltransferase RsmG [Pyrinomonadaceae bacterium]|jgi:16S rRNA (guanine527-N7)-methyltransferase|nr:16S rRNA (guanine(527)-N(7))-methyltransferase RsmG [Pyrinomonadaceae bacterium]
MERDSAHADEFVSALEKHAPLYDVRLTAPAITHLREYYEQVIAWNARLHLVAPCSPAEFATRHILESLLALPYLSEDARVVDVGSGAGLPIIPCLVARPRLRATLIDSSQKKAIFLREALQRVGAHEAAKVIAGRFEKIPAPEADYLTCRALDRFTEIFPRLVEWSSRVNTLLLFGGDTLREQIENLALTYQAIRIPQSERRFLYVIKKESKV